MGRRSRNRRGRSKQIFRVVNSSYLPQSGKEVEFNRTTLEIPTDRAYRIIRVVVQASAELHPGLLQVSLCKFDVDSSLKYARYALSPVSLIAVNSVRTISVKGLNTDGAWHGMTDNSTSILVQSPCLSTVQKGGAISFVIHATIELSEEQDDRICKSIPEAIPTIS